MFSSRLGIRSSVVNGLTQVAQRRCVVSGLNHKKAVDKPLIIFTIGIPGAGKTYALNRRYGIENVVMLDLDQEICKHPLFDHTCPSSIYSHPDAYDWADDALQQSFERVIHSNPQPMVVAVDGTGTKIQKRIQRMKQARDAGYWIRLVHVVVPIEQAFERNQKRQRCVPRDVLVKYAHCIEKAVEAEKEYCDEFEVFDNTTDDRLTGRQRWKQWYTLYNERFNSHRTSEAMLSDCEHMSVDVPLHALPPDDHLFEPIKSHKEEENEPRHEPRHEPNLEGKSP